LTQLLFVEARSTQDVFLCVSELLGGKLFNNLALLREEFDIFWPFLLECLAFFRNFVGRFWPFFLRFGLFLKNKSCNVATEVCGCVGGIISQRFVVLIGLQQPGCGLSPLLQGIYELNTQ